MLAIRTRILRHRTLMGGILASFRSGSGDGIPPTDFDPELKRRAESDPKSLSNSDWRKLLSPKQFEVTRESGTEMAFTGDLHDNKKPGEYLCVCCEAELFSSEAKYDSGSGWPSFYEPSKPEHVEEKRDAQFGMIRTEVRCKRCGAHLGHVFNDGPRPTGQRFCINSAALKFNQEKE